MNLKASDLQPRKIRLAVRMWGLLALIKLALWRRPLPRVVERLARPPRRPPPVRLDPDRLSWINGRVLRIGGYQPRCLIRSLVHFRMLRAQGDAAELVIGLPRAGDTTDAHAWVEIAGRVVGPPPGRAGHAEFVRYPRPAQQADTIGSR